MSGQSNSKNQLYGDTGQVPGLKFQPQSVAQPPAQAYGAQGMRGRLIRMGLPRLPGPSLGQQSVQSAYRRIK